MRVIAHRGGFVRSACWAWGLLCLAGCRPSPLTPVAEVPVLQPAALSRTPVWIRAVGDIQLERGIERAYQGSDLYTLFDGVRHLLRVPDVTFGNLESVIAHGGSRKPGGIAFRAHPLVSMALETAGFNVLSVANNHAHDFGRPALLETARRLRERGILPVGVAVEVNERQVPAIIEAHGLRVGVLAYSVFQGTDARLDESPARLTAMKEDILKVRTHADLVLVSMHWGVEYHTTPTPEQIRLGRSIIDAGADMLIGHHPHVLQGVEIYHGKIIAYSLGNFLFDQPWPHTRDGLLLDWRGIPGGVPEVRLYPIRIRRRPYRTTVLLGEEGRALLQRCADLSERLGTLGQFEQDNWRVRMSAMTR